MTSNIDVILLPRARKDVRDILQYTFDMWGSDQRDVYRREPDRMVILRVVSPRRRR